MNSTLVIGHTTGIGKEITELLSADGVSKSTGFDISESHSEFDYSCYNLIVLNAYSEFPCQLKTLYDIIENKSFSKDKLLVVVSSTSAYKTDPSNLYWAKYYAEKSAIIKAGRDLNTMGYNVSVISPATVDTHRNIMKSIPKLDPKDIARTVQYIYNMYSDKILIEHLVIRTAKI